MWEAEHSIETSATPQEIWGLWADVAGWPAWNADIEEIELTGPFAAGSTIRMTPIGQEPIELRIAEAVKPELFVDEADLGEIVVRTTHRVQPLDEERARVTYRMEITGLASDTLGSQIGAGDQRRLPANARCAGRACGEVMPLHPNDIPAARSRSRRRGQARGYWAPARRLVFTWSYPGKETDEVEITLSPEVNATVLELEQRSTDAMDWWLGAGAGWESALVRLALLLQGEDPRQIADAEFDQTVGPALVRCGHE
jgi:hypothetical protein